MTLRKRTLVKGGLVVLLAALLAAGLWYRRGLRFYQLEPYPCDFSEIQCQVSCGESVRSLDIGTGLARDRIFETMEALRFHRPALNLIARPLGLWRRPSAEEGYCLSLNFQGAGFSLRIVFSGGRWYYQNTGMEGLLPCSVQPRGAEKGEELGRMLWEMVPLWEAYGYD